MRTWASLVGLAACLATAMAMHLLFDAPGPGLAILLKVLINFVVVLALYLTLRRGYRARARAVRPARLGQAHEQGRAGDRGRHPDPGAEPDPRPGLAVPASVPLGPGVTSLVGRPPACLHSLRHQKSPQKRCSPCLRTHRKQPEDGTAGRHAGLSPSDNSK